MQCQCPNTIKLLTDETFSYSFISNIRSSSKCAFSKAVKWLEDIALRVSFLGGTYFGILSVCNILLQALLPCKGI